LLLASVFSEATVIAAESELKIAEGRVAEFAAKNGKKSAEYARQLLSLSAVYQRAGERKKAQKCYEESLAVAKTLPESKVLLPQIMLLYAGTLCLDRKLPETAQTNKKELAALLAREKLAHEKDLDKAEQILSQSLALLDRDKAVNRTRYLACFQYIQLLSKRKKTKEAGLNKDKLNKILAESEKSKDLKDADLYVLAGTLEQLSVFYTGYFTSNEDPADSFKKTSKEDYEKGRALRLRALALLDRLPQQNPRRMEAHKVMDRFYKFYGRSKTKE